MRNFRGFAAFVALGFSVFSFSPSASAGPISIFNFQVNGLGVYPTGRGSEITGQLSWTPSVDIGVLGVRGLLGVSLPKNSLGDRVVATHYEVYAMLGLLPFITLEVGGGVVGWANYAGSGLAIGGNLSIPTVGPVDRVIVGYSRFTAGAGMDFLRLGIGFGF